MPTRSRTKALELNPDLEFEFYLADRLGLTVADMRRKMSNLEFTYWAMFHGRKAQRRQLAQLKAEAAAAAGG